MPKLKKIGALIIFGLILIIAAFIRFWVAPLSAGPDVAQFWGFAEAFRLYGLDFYRYSGAQADFFPFKYLAYVYPPVWLLLLGLALLVVPSSSASHDMVDAGWRLAMKTPIILADLSIGGLLFWAVPGSRLLKLLFATLWLLNPAVWYNSSVFGQFDSVATAFLLASIILLEKQLQGQSPQFFNQPERTKWFYPVNLGAFILAALAVMTKQHTLIPVGMVLLACSRQINRGRLMTGIVIMFGIGAFLSLPFLVTGNFLTYFRAIIFPGQAPDYQYPQMYAFNAWSASLSYLHTQYGWDTLGLIKLGIPLVVLGLILAAVLCYLKRASILRGALIGMLVFIICFYRINYQYLVVVIALALFVASRTHYHTEKTLALGLAIFPSIWLWMINVATWFVYLRPTDISLVPLLDRIGLTHQDFPNYTFVIFSILLNLLAISYVILAFTRWKAPLKSLNYHKGSN